MDVWAKDATCQSVKAKDIDREAQNMSQTHTITQASLFS